MNKQYRTVFAASAAVSLIFSGALYLTLKSGFDSLDQPMDDLVQSTQEMEQATQEMLESTEELSHAIQRLHDSSQKFGQAVEELGNTVRDVDTTIQSTNISRPGQITRLCNNIFYWNRSPCENITLSDGSVISIERDRASKHLIETVDELRSGERDSAFEETLPAEEAEQILFYDSMG